MTAHAGTIAAFLRCVHGRAIEARLNGVVVLNWVDERRLSKCFALDQIDQAADFAASISDRGLSVFYRVSLLDERVDRWHRGTSKQTRWITHFAGDVDIAGPGHSPPDGKALPSTVDEAVELIDNTLVPQMIVSSGGGLYPIWRLDAPVDLAVADNRQRVVEVGTRLDKALKGHGWHVDAVCKDLSRVIRTAGVDNYKPGRDVRPVTVLRGTIDAPADYSLADLEVMLPALPPKAPRPSPTSRTHAGGGIRLRSSTDISVFDIFNEQNTLEDILDADPKHQWEQVDDQGGMEAWLRVGSTAEYSLKRSDTGAVIVWSATVAAELGIDSGGGIDLWGLACSFADRDPTETAKRGVA